MPGFVIKLTLILGILFYGLVAKANDDPYHLWWDYYYGTDEGDEEPAKIETPKVDIKILSDRYDGQENAAYIGSRKGGGRQ